MVSALVNGVRGGRWFSLIDKVYAPATLAAAWTRVRANRGAVNYADERERTSLGGARHRHPIIA